MSGVRVEITGRDASLAQLHAMGAQLDNAQPMYDEIGGYLESAISQNFAREQGPAGNPWPKSLRALVEGGKTLDDTHHLKDTISHNAWATGTEVGSNVPYAAIHQFGGIIKAKTAKGLAFNIRSAGANKPQRVIVKSVKMPARPFIGMDDEDEAEIIHIAASWLARAAGGPDAR